MRKTLFLKTELGQIVVPRLENSSWGTILVGVGLASGFLHYFMDRAVYRLSDAETRMSAKNLLFG